MKESVLSVIGTVIFATFIAAKLSGPLVAWSWWWVFFSIVPVIALVCGWA